MSSIETYYLIDFENVNDEGLNGSNTLGKHDHVHLFYTDHAKRISLDTLNMDSSCKFSIHKVPASKNSLDMHLVSYLGYLLGTNPCNSCKYVIISKDTDYDNIISFWKAQNFNAITRRNNITNQTTQLKSNSKKVPIKNSQTISAKKCSLNTEIQQAISQAGYEPGVINKVASIVVGHLNETNAMNHVHNELRATYTNYSDLYKIVKPILNKYLEPTTNSSKRSKTPNLNTEIQKRLSNANISNDMVNYVASLVCKHHSEKNGKQTIYRGIISKCGQKQGLNIYNHIKNQI